MPWRRDEEGTDDGCSDREKENDAEESNGAGKEGDEEANICLSVIVDEAKANDGARVNDDEVKGTDDVVAENVVARANGVPEAVVACDGLSSFWIAVPRRWNYGWVCSLPVGY